MFASYAAAKKKQKLDTKNAQKFIFCKRIEYIEICRIESEKDVQDDILLELSELSICLFENCKSRHRDFWGVEANSFRHSRAPDQLKQRGLLGVEACVKTCRDGGVSDPKETLRHYVIVLYIYIHIYIHTHHIRSFCSKTCFPNSIS